MSVWADAINGTYPWQEQLPQFGYTHIDPRDKPIAALDSQKAFDLLTSRSAELRIRAQKKDYFDMSRDKFTFAAEQIEKLIEEIKAL